MIRLRVPSLLVLLLLLGGCATARARSIRRSQETDPRAGYRFETRQAQTRTRRTWSSSRSPAAARARPRSRTGFWSSCDDTEIVGPKGNKARLLDEVDVITGVSGGSFTALAYGLYGDKLFDDYEQRFLKRDVQGEIVSRTFSPANWGKLWSTAWGRSELAAELYDEILFNDATFGDLNRGKGPLILASATDISTGSRFVFNQRIFDVICSDLNAVQLSRAAAASSAVPVVLSPVTLNNYGGTCNTITPHWVKPFLDTDNPPRPAARAIRSLKAEQAFGDGVHRPYLHLVDGGVSDNVGMRAVLDALEILEALHEAGVPTPFDNARRIIVFIVNSLSSPPTNWDESESAARHRGHPAQVGGHADRRLFLRGGRAAEGHCGTVADAAPSPRFGRVCRQQGSRGRRRAARPGRRDLCHRRVVPGAEGQGGARLSESAADVVRAAARGGRSPARGGGDDHPWNRPNSSAC